MADRVLRDVNGIHLKKNHSAYKPPPQQQHKPIFGGKSLLRDLVVLQRSRTLRDPSEKCSFVNGRRSIAPDGGESVVQRGDEVCYGDDDDVAASCNKDDGRSAAGNRAKGRSTYRGGRRSMHSSGYEWNNASDVSAVASNSFAQMYSYDDFKTNGVRTDGCGIPWSCSKVRRGGGNKSTIHGKAGEDLSRRLSMSRKGRISDHPLVVSESSSSSAMSNSLEVLPLLLHSDSQMDFDFMSEGKSWSNDGHVNFTLKYMPRTFKDLIGQTLAARSLSNAVSTGKIGSLYVFYGPQGAGKTSCARIFARALNCRSRAGPKPCGFCDSCVAHDRGSTHDVREIGSSNIELKNVGKLFDSPNGSRRRPRYKVLIFDECDALARDQWCTLVKAVDLAPRHVVFVLVCSGLDVLPRVIISRAHKFFFPKIRNGDIMRILRFVADREGIEIDEEAVELIASISNGSLRDAEMTLEQLSLLGRKISPQLVRELAGLALDEKLIDLLDLALSGDSVNTVKILREMGESGVEPLALTSQLATVITDILAGKSNVINNNEMPRRKFFRRQVLTKHDMEKLRRALKTLSEAEKQLRASNDKMTWLTIAILQLASSDSKHSPDDRALSDNNATSEDNACRGNNSMGAKSTESEILELIEASSQRDRKASISISRGDARKPDEMDDRNLGLVKAKVPLAQVIRLVEGYSRNGLWSSLRSVSMAEKLEKDSLRLESRSRRLLCWKTPRRTKGKHSSRLKMRRRIRPRMLLRFVYCGKCPSFGSCL